MCYVFVGSIVYHGNDTVQIETTGYYFLSVCRIYVGGVLLSVYGYCIGIFIQPRYNFVKSIYI